MQLLQLYFEFSSVFPYFAFSFASYSVYLYISLPVLLHFLVSSFHFTSFYHGFDIPDAMTVRLTHLNISLAVTLFNVHTNKVHSTEPWRQNHYI
jgi:hypothetical protein